jgi:hypothetical protein
MQSKLILSQESRCDLEELRLWKINEDSLGAV